MTELRSHVSDAQAISTNAGFDVEKGAIKQRGQTYQEKQVLLGKAKQSVAKGLLRDLDADDPGRIVAPHQMSAAVGSNSDPTPIVDILEDCRGNQWYTIEINFLQEFSPGSPKVYQTGVSADETEKTTFTVWANTSLPNQPLTPCESYRPKGVMTNWWEKGDKPELYLHSATEIQRLQTNPDVNTRRGVLATLQPGSGIIKRCPGKTCILVLQGDRCREHGPVDGELDLRIKRLLDTGTATTTAYLNREQTEQLTSISFREMNKIRRFLPNGPYKHAGQ